MQNKTYLLRPRPLLLLVTTSRLSFKRFRIDAEGKKSERGGKSTEYRRKNNTQGRRPRERKNIQTIESAPGSTALPNLSLLQEKKISQQQARHTSALHSPRAWTRVALRCLPTAFPHPHLILSGSSSTDVPMAGPTAERTTSL